MQFFVCFWYFFRGMFSNLFQNLLIRVWGKPESFGILLYNMIHV